MNLMHDWRFTVFVALVFLILGLILENITFCIFFIILAVIAYLELKLKKEDINE